MRISGMPVVAALALPYLQLFNADGDPLAGGKLYSYQAGTVTPIPTYTDASGNTANTNPVLANAAGIMSVWLQVNTAYKLQVRDAADQILSTVDNVLLQPQPTISSIGGLSATAAQGNSVLDPGEPGAEVLATSLAQEIQQLRFILSELKSNSNWRQSVETVGIHNAVADPGEPGAEVLAQFGVQELAQIKFVLSEIKGNIPWGQSYTVRHMPLSIRDQAADNAIWAQSGTSVINLRAFVPDGWQPGANFAVYLYRRALTAVAGTAKMYFQYARIREGQPINLSSTAAIDFSPPDLNSHLAVFTFAGTNFQATDGIFILLARTGDDAGDTYNGSIALDSVWLEYTGIASR
jgi:hypothetical protein